MLSDGSAAVSFSKTYPEEKSCAYVANRENYYQDSYKAKNSEEMPLSIKTG